MQAFRVPWSSASFLCYLGGLTVLAALASLLDVQAGSHGAGGFSGWALLIFAATTGIALAARATGHRVVAGLVALSAVGAFVVFLGSLLEWLGWLSHHDVDSPFAGFRVSWLLDAFEGTFGRRPSHPWAGPLVFVATGAVFGALGVLTARRRRVAGSL